MLPRGLKLGDSLLLHLTGQIWAEAKGDTAGYWRIVRDRHDLLDCLVYALALALLHRHMPDRRDDGETLMPQMEETPPEASWLGDNSRWKL